MLSTPGSFVLSMLSQVKLFHEAYKMYTEAKVSPLMPVNKRAGDMVTWFDVNSKKCVLTAPDWPG